MRPERTPRLSVLWTFQVQSICQLLQKLRLIIRCFVRNTVQELPYPGIGTVRERVFRANSDQFAVPEKGNPVRDSKRAPELVGNYEHRYVEGILQIEHEFINTGGCDWIEAR